MRKTSALAVAAAMLGLAATSFAATERPPPQIIGTPSLTYAYGHDERGRYVTVGAVFRTDRDLDRRTYAPVAAPRLRTGQRLPDAGFGGVTPGAIGRPGAHCYVAEVGQVVRRAHVYDRSWALALQRADIVTSRVKHVTVRRNHADAYRGAPRAARRLGC